MADFELYLDGALAPSQLEACMDRLSALSDTLHPLPLESVESVFEAMVPAGGKPKPTRLRVKSSESSGRQLVYEGPLEVAHDLAPKASRRKIIVVEAGARVEEFVAALGFTFAFAFARRGHEFCFTQAGITVSVSAENTVATTSLDEYFLVEASALASPANFSTVEAALNKIALQLKPLVSLSPMTRPAPSLPAVAARTASIASAQAPLARKA